MILWSLGGLLVLGVVVWRGFSILENYLKYNVEAARNTGMGVPVKVTVARMEEFPEMIGANSLTEPIVTIDVKTPETLKVGGMVKTVYVDLGRMVSKGDKLVELDPTLYVAAVKSADAQVVKTKTELKNSALYMERISTLYTEGVVAKLTLEQATLSVDKARSEHAKAQEDRVVAQYNLAQIVVLAPTNGVIMKRPGEGSQIVDRIVSPGEFVSAGDKLLTMGEVQSIMVVAQVPEEKVGSVHLRQEAEIVLDSYPTLVLSGHVEKIDPQTDPEKRTFKAYIRVDDPKKLKLTPGLAAYSRLQHKRQALTIPRLAVIKNAGEASVFVVKNSRAHLRRIRTGVELLHKVEVLSGLKPGEQVVHYGLLGLKDKDLVNLETYNSSN